MFKFLVPKRFNSSSIASHGVKKTALYDLHTKLGGKMVPFAGYMMPLLYPGIQSHIESHKWVRQHAGLFDVSHMLQSKLYGKDALALLNRITPTDYSVVEPSFGSLSVLIKEQTGGIVDDLLIFKQPRGQEGFHIVTNASRVKEDSEFIREQITKLVSEGKDVSWEPISQHALLALQGPEASKVLSTLVKNPQDVKNLVFGQRDNIELRDGTQVGVMRGGYTGEDGFEISIHESRAIEFSEQLLSNNVVKPIGLAARDSLRLEAGMCLYGNELNDTLTPVEGSLKWLISKSRRADPNPESRFNGYERIMDQLNNKNYKQTRIGFRYKDATPAPAARTGCKILNKDTLEQVGTVTSGSISPSLSDEANKKIVNIGQGYVDLGLHKSGTELLVEVRRKKFPIVISKMPLVPTSYYRG